MDKFYITTSIMYSTQKPHFGNTYEAIMTDSVARFKRQMGYDVFFLTGADEHGKKVETYAEESGVDPKTYVNNITSQIIDLWKTMNISYDKFIRTTDDYHEKAIKNIFTKLYEQGDIYKGIYEDWYCLPDESFFTETQLIDGKCPECGRPVQRMEEEVYYLRTSKYQDWLLQYIEENPQFIEPEARRKEMVNNFLKAGLKDLCVTRSTFKWGIPVPFDDGHVIYVWIDALPNYITALGYDVDEQGENFHKYWPVDAHIIGKDIMRFHSIYWTIILKMLGLALPKKIFGHPWYNFNDQRFSKSLGNVVYNDELAAKFGADAVRYYALAEMPYAADGDFTYKNFIAKYNADLANNLGNLVNRTMAMTNKYFDGVVPAPVATDPLDDDLKQTAEKAIEEFKSQMDSFHIADAVETVFTMLRRANKYIDETTPWILAKDEENKARLGTVLYNLLEMIRLGAVLLTPIIPTACENIFKQINTDVKTMEFGGLAAGNNIGEAEVLFNRLDEEKIIAELEAEAVAKELPEKPEGLAQIGIDDFMGVELRTAEVIACEPVPKAKKLLKLQLNLGYEKRQVVSGIAEFYKPDDLIGKKVIVVANLKPAVLRGIESNGMILASGEETIRVVFLDPQTPNGERVR
jgi:methionyl-tRNA synthetase/methionyl-tRNA synthetase C-terminal region/beta chain